MPLLDYNPSNIRYFIPTASTMILPTVKHKRKLYFNLIPVYCRRFAIYFVTYVFKITVNQNCCVDRYAICLIESYPHEKFLIRTCLKNI